MTEKLFRAINRSELITDLRFAINTNRLKNVTELDTIISAFIGQHTQQDCLQLFQNAGVTVGPVYDMSDIERDPHFHARQIVVELPDTELGTIPVHTISPRLAATPGRFRKAAPHLGEDTYDVLREIGYAHSEVEALISSGLAKQSESSNQEQA
jgi:crotonobetainyl-CoA:carnitine CoA-transferase CaiB-like acyl-CoA transferase